MIKKIKQWFCNITKIYVVVSHYSNLSSDSFVDSIWWSEKKAQKRVDKLNLIYPTCRAYYFSSHLNKMLQY